MKEYLTKNSSGNYQLVNHRFSEDDIAVPQGADVAVYPHFSKGISFFKNNFRFAYSDSLGEWRETDYCPENLKHWNSWRVAWQRESLNDKIATAEVARKEEKHSHYKKDVSHLKMIDPYRIADLYDLHPCADHIMKKSLCAGNRGHKDTLRDIQDIIDTAERWKQMIEEDNGEL